MHFPILGNKFDLTAVINVLFPNNTAAISRGAGEWMRRQLFEGAALVNVIWSLAIRDDRMKVFCHVVLSVSKAKRNPND